MIDYIIRTKEDLKRAVEEMGILPLFTNSIPGFSVEEHVDPKIWFTEEPGPWDWKGPVIREMQCAYGKFFEHKAAFVSKEWFPDLANFRRDGYDFDARFDDELASYKDKALFDLVDAKQPVLSAALKKAGNYKKGGNAGFDTIMGRLQAQCYILISDFRYMTDRHGKEYGWGVAEYSTPEHFLGEAFTDRVYERDPAESYQKLLRHLKEVVPDSGEGALVKFLSGGAACRPDFGEHKDWIIPSNPKYYDIVGAFAAEREILWKQGNENIHVGDTVYMYVGAPYSAILYRCTVTETGIPYAGKGGPVNLKQLMRIRMEEMYDGAMLHMSVLKSRYNIVTVRGPRFMPAEVIRDIREGRL